MRQKIIDHYKRIIEQNLDALTTPDVFLVHIETTYDIADEVCAKIIESNPGIDSRLSREEVRLAAGLHDIGRPKQKEQLFHEIRGAQHIEQHGVSEGFASSESGAYRLAQMIRPHGAVYEQFTSPALNPVEKDKFRGLDTTLLLPRSWQEHIVAYADLMNSGGKRMESVNQVIGLLLPRYRNEYKNHFTADCFEQALPRLNSLHDRVEALKHGKIPAVKIIRYGFL